MNWNLEFTKFFEVNSPKGIEQNEKEKDAEFNSVGVDIFVPKPTRAFLNALLLANKEAGISLVYSKYLKDNNLDTDILLEFGINIIGGTRFVEFYADKYLIHANVQIPTGIGILIPKGYHFDLRSKSGDFKNKYTSVMGLIDCNYTYGMGVQITKINNADVVLKPDEKFAQLVMIKSNLIDTFTEIPQKEWDIKEDVISRRENRKGGFGHSGRF